MEGNVQRRSSKEDEARVMPGVIAIVKVNFDRKHTRRRILYPEREVIRKVAYGEKRT